MAKVEDLMNYYNNLHNASVATSVASANNKTQVNIESARLGAEARRLDQEKQLEFFRQQMNNAREARAVASAEDIAAKKIAFETGQGILDKTFTGTENAKRREFDMRLQELSDEKAMGREQFKADISARDTAQKLMAEGPYERARTATERMKPAIDERKILIDEYTALQKQASEGAGIWGMGQTEENKKRMALLASIEDRLAKLGTDVKNDIDVLEKPETREAAFARENFLTETIDSDFAEMTNEAKENVVRRRLLLTRSKINGTHPTKYISPENADAAIQEILDYAKKIGVDTSKMLRS